MSTEFKPHPGEQELLRGEATNYRGLFDFNDGDYVITNMRLMHCTDPWYLNRRARGTALLSLIARACGYKPVWITYEVPLNQIAGIQYVEHMLTTGFKIRDFAHREIEIHVGISSTAEQWRNNFLGLMQSINPSLQIIPHPDNVWAFNHGA